MKKATSKAIFKALGRSNAFLIAFLLFTFLLSLFLFSPLFAWTEPTELPPEGNVPPPLNRGVETLPSSQYTWDKIGIGTSSVSQKLDVVGNLNIRDAQSNWSGLRIQPNYPLESFYANYISTEVGGTGSHQPIIFRTNNINRLTITPQGNIGIGTTEPATRLDVGKGDRDNANAPNTEWNVISHVANPVHNSDAANKEYVDSASVDHASTADYATNAGAADHATYANSAQRATYLGNSFDVTADAQGNLQVNGTGDSYIMGNVGIGTTSPLYNLHIYGTDTERSIGIQSTVGSAVLYLKSGESSPSQIYQTKDQNDLRFWVNGGDKMIIDSAGNVGIGTTTPKNKLDVEGGAVIGANYSGTNTAPSNGLLVEGNVGIGTTSPNNLLHIRANEDGRGLTIQRNSTNENSYADLSFLMSTTSDGIPDTYIRTYRRTGWEDQDMVFHVSGGDVMYLENGGNVGIGTTSPTSLLSVGSNSQFQVNSSGDIVKLKNLTYSWPSSHTAQGVLTNDGSGTLNWSTIGSSGITPDSLDFTEFKDTMTLDANLSVGSAGFNTTWNGNFYHMGGRVGIDTLNPQSSLDVNGSAKVQSITITTGAAEGKVLACEDNTGTAYWKTISEISGVTGDGSSGQVTFWTGTSSVDGDNNFYWDNTNKHLGIGTTSPLSKLYVKSSLATTPVLSLEHAASPSSDYFQIRSSGATGGDILTVDSSGEVGIGIASPSVALDINGNLTSDSQITAGTKFLVGSSEMSSSQLIVNGDTIYTTADGKVGIGTTTPKNRLDVEGGAVIGATYSGTNTAPSNGLLVEGNVGIGTTSFAGNQTKMQVSGGDIYLADPVFDDDKDVVTKAYVRDTLIPSGGVQGVGNGQANYIAKWANDNTITKTTTPIFEKDGNKIGIAKDNPAMALDVFGDINSSEQVIAGTKFQVGASEMTSSQLIVNGNTIYTLENGNVGIGTTTPGYKLDVSGTLNGTTLYQNGQTLDERFITGAHPTNLLPNSRFLDYTDATHAYNWVNFSPGKREIVDAIINTQTGLSVDVWDDSGWSTTNEYIWMTDANIDFSDSYLVGKYVVFTGNPTASLKDYKGEIVELDEPNHKVRLRIPEGWNKVIGIPATPTVGEEYNIVAIANRSTKCVKFYANASNYNQTVYSLYFTIPGNEKIAISYDQYIRSLGSKGMYVQYEVTDANGKMVYRWAGPGSTTSNTNNWVVKRFNPIGPFNNPDNWAGAEVGATVTPTFRMRIMFKYYDSTNQGEWYVTGVNVNAGELAYAYTPHYLSEEDSNAKLQGNLTLDGTLNAGATTLAGLTVDTDTLYVDSTNHRVGIGTTAPGAKLHIYDSDYTKANLKIQTDSGDGTIWNAIELINPASSGWAGSGIHPVNIDFSSSSGNPMAAIGAGYDGSGHGFIDFHSIYNGGVKTDTDVVMRIKGDGNVGIGTTVPATRLDVGKGDRDNAGAPDTEWNVISHVATPVFNGDAANKDYVDSSIVAGDVNHASTADYATTAGAADHATYANSAQKATYLGNSFNVTADAQGNLQVNGTGDSYIMGKVGIGTTEPAYKLDVRGEISAGAPGATNQIHYVAVPTAPTDAATKGYVDDSITAGDVNHASTADYAANAGAADHATYANSALRAQYLGNSFKVTADDQGKVGIGTTEPQQKLDVYTPNADNYIQVRRQDNTQKSGLIFATTNPVWYNYVDTGTGNSSLVWQNATDKLMTLTQDGNLQFNNSTASAIKSYAPLSIEAGDPSQDVDLTLRGSNNGKVVVDDELSVTNEAHFVSAIFDVSTGGQLNMNQRNIIDVNKLTVNTIDPVHLIDGKEYATYVSFYAGGQKMETSGLIRLEIRNSKSETRNKSKISKSKIQNNLEIRDSNLEIGEVNYQYLIDFNNLEEGSDLWLFWKTIHQDLSKVVVLLTPSFNGRVWYEKIDNSKILIAGDTQGEVSYCLTAPREDYQKWPNLISKAD